MTFDWVVVGAGYSGATLAERLASQLGHRVLVIDQRHHIAGNAYDYLDEHGLLIHKYGPHIFHTNSERVWCYLSQFTDWLPYEHRVRARIEGLNVPVPFNLNTLRALFTPTTAKRLRRKLLARYGLGAQVPILEMRKESDRDLANLARYVYEHVFVGYTVKQWGLPPDQLDPAVTARVPVRVSDDDRYFQDAHQAMPLRGYTEMFRRILAQSNITVALGMRFEDVAQNLTFDRLAYTGTIDGFFQFRHGALPYRTLDFEFRHDGSRDFVQEVGQVNYPNEHDYTRITEFKHLTGQRVSGTTVAYEYPGEHLPGVSEPYYPIPRAENRALHRQYVAEAHSLGGKIYFLGRLADYKYYNMDQAVARALAVFDTIAAADRTSHAQTALRA